MAVSDYSTTPGSNVTISGINIAENCPPGNINNAFRQMMADVKGLQATIPSLTGLAPLASPVFTGQPTFTGRGAFLHYNDSGNTSGRVYILADGSANPASPANGDIVLFFTP